MGIKKKLMTMALAFAAPLAVLGGKTIRSHAATDMGITQIGASENSVSIEWDSQMAVYGTDIHYHVYISTDGSNWNEYDTGFDSDDTDIKITSLNPTSNYYVKVVCYSGAGFGMRHSNDRYYTEQIVQVMTSSEQVEDAKQTDTTKNSVTLSWSAAEGAEYYNIYEETGYDTYEKVTTSNTTSVVIGGLSTSTCKTYYVAAVRVGLNGYEAVGSKSDNVTAYTIPSAVKKVTAGTTWLGYNRWDWTDVDNETGYQYEIRSAKGKKVYSKGTTGAGYAYTTLSPSATNGKFIKVRARAYVTVNGKNYYSSWSPYLYCANCKKTVTSRSTNGKKITLKWSKISKATSYRIYISTDKDMGYKKVATVSSKKASYVIKKYGKKSLKKGTTYYVRLKYVIKIGKKNYVSPYYSQMTVY